MLKNHLSFLVMGVFLLTAVVGEAKWYTALDGSKYFIDPGYNFNWYEAYITCANLKLSLVTITSDEKNSALIDVIKQTGRDHYWIGGVKIGGKNGSNFHWITTGKPFEYQHWNMFSPNNIENFKCANIGDFYMQWYNNDCQLKRYGLLCEQSPRDIEKNKKFDAIDNAFIGLLHILESRLKDERRKLCTLLGLAKDKAMENQKKIDQALMGSKKE